VKYGRIHDDSLPDVTMLGQLEQLFARAMNVQNAAPLVTTNDLCSAEVVQPDMNDFFKNDNYSMVNNEILAAGGISGTIVAGMAVVGSSFASAQISMQSAAIRIEQAKDNFCEMMSKINVRLNGILPKSSANNIPAFIFPPVDLAGSEKFQKTCRDLWEQGVVSTETMLQTHGYDMKQEVERKKRENKNNIDEILAPPEAIRENNDGNDGDSGSGDEGGRPRLDDDERNSDPGNSETGRQPKPSHPDGSEPLD